MLQLVNDIASPRMATVISVAVSTFEFTEARALFQEYAAGLDVDLSFQNFAQELQDIATMYGPPDGCLLLARKDNELVGCVGFRPCGADVCELKRLYVRQGARGTGIGRQLVIELLYKARAAAYRTVVLDTLPSMRKAQALYRSFGFRVIPTRHVPPVEGMVYMQLDLN